MPQLAQGVHLLPPGCTEDFKSCLYLLVQRGLSICSRLHSLKGEEDFFYSRLHSLKGEEDLFLPTLAQSRGELFLPALAQSRGGLSLACTRSKSRRTFSLTRLHSLKGEEDFSLSCPKTHESVEVFSHHWCLRSPKDDEDFKTLTTVADRRKTMGTLNF